MYPKPNSIRVEVGGKTIKPISLLDNNGEGPLNTSVCGGNKFFYKNYTIHFVVTGDPNCRVRVTLTNSIQLTARFAMNIDDFFRDDGQTRFINRMCALLSINDTSRVKIVGVYTGSIQIVSIITPPAIPLSQSTQVDPIAQYALVAEMQDKLNELVENGTFKNEMAEAGLGELTDVSSIILGEDPTQKPPTPEEETKKSTGMIVGIVIGSTATVCLTVVAIVFYMRRKSKVMNEGQIVELPHETESHAGPGTHNSEKIGNLSTLDFKHNIKTEENE